MKQYNFFGNEQEDTEKSQYTSKIEAPIYEPKNRKPNVFELCDQSKSSKFVNKIEQSNVTEEEKVFLKQAAKRHNIFNYEKIADYYAHATDEMQELMEDSALVIIDFDKAIELGYVKLCKDIKNQYLTEQGE